MRRRGHSYAAGWYLVTITTWRRLPYLGGPDGGGRQEHTPLTPAGRVADQLWRDLPRRFPDLRLDAFVIDRDHLHGLLGIGGPAWGPASGRGAINIHRAQSPAEGTGGAMDPAGRTVLGEIIRSFKAAATRRIRVEHNSDFAWQRGYHDRIIEDERAFAGARRYIARHGQPAALGGEELPR